MAQQIRVFSNYFRVSNERLFKKIMRKARTYGKGKLKVTKHRNGRFTLAAETDILGYDSNDDGYDYEQFVTDLQDVVVDNEAIIIYTTYISRDVDVEYTIITKLLHYEYTLHSQVVRDAKHLLSVNPSDYVNIVEFGMLEDMSDADDEYLVYDRRYGYYDKERYYEPVFEDARIAAFDYVTTGGDQTYAIVSRSYHTVKSFAGKNIYDTPVEDEKCEVPSIIYSVAKINGKIVENFVKRKQQTR